MPRATYQVSRPGFVADPNSVVQDVGRQIDWDNVDAAYADAVTGKKVLPAGTVVGELLSGDGKVSPRVVTTNPAIGILITDAIQDDPSAAKTGYGVYRGGHFWENLLPDAAGGPPAVLAAAIKTELAANGAYWLFTSYSDNRNA